MSIYSNAPKHKIMSDKKLSKNKRREIIRNHIDDPIKLSIFQHPRHTSNCEKLRYNRLKKGPRLSRKNEYDKLSSYKIDSTIKINDIVYKDKKISKYKEKDKINKLYEYSFNVIWY